MMSIIPGELYNEILLRLPVKSLLKCKCVCKSWFKLISDPDFVKSHLNFTIASENTNSSLMCLSSERKIYTVGYDSLLSSQNESCDNVVELDFPIKSVNYVEVFDSCNGLVLLSYYDSGRDDKRSLCIWNPATREYKELSKSSNDVINQNIGIFALSYDYKIDDYKVFKTVDVGGTNTSLVHVYQLGLDIWKSIQTIPYRFHCDRTSGALVNGSLHWLGESNDAGVLDKIVCLDISNDIFQEVKLPGEALENEDLLFENVEVLKGCLCVLTCLISIDCFEVWMMLDYGIQESWTKHYVITHERITNKPLFKIMCSFKNGEILLLTTNDVLIYDPRNSSARLPKIGSFIVVNAVKLVESLVSFNSLGRSEGQKSDINMK